MKKKPSINLIASIIVMITVIGFSTAYYIAQLSKSGDNANAIMLTKTLGLRFTDGPEFNLNGALPGQKTIKTFSVQNTGNVTSSYNLAFVDVVNELTRKSDLVYTISSTNNGYSNNTEQNVPDSNYTFASNITIPANTTQTYTLVVEYKNVSINQNVDMNKNVSFKINITDVDTTYGARIAAGIYNDNDELISSWDELIALEYISVEDGEVTSDRDFEKDSNVITGKLVIDDSVTTIGYDAFMDWPISSVFIPATVTSIDNNAFNGCNLNNVTFEEDSGLTYIGSLNFSGINTTNMILPEGLLEIDNAFIDANIENLYIPSTVTNVSDYAFTSCNISNLVFADGIDISAIGENAFSESHILAIEYSNGWTEIPVLGYDASYLESVTFPNSLETISGLELSETKITSVTIPASVTSIGEGVFKNNEYLTELIIAPNSHLETIGDEAFSSTAITSVTIPASVTSIGTAFSYIGNLYSVTFASNSQIETIVNTAFVEDYSLASITIPASVVEIGDYAFLDTGLQSISFESNSHLTTIGSMAFSTSNTISDVYVPSSVTSISDNAFYGVENLHYSGSAVEEYEGYWGASNIIRN